MQAIREQTSGNLYPCSTGTKFSIRWKFSANSQTLFSKLIRFLILPTFKPNTVHKHAIPTDKTLFKSKWIVFRYRHKIAINRKNIKYVHANKYNK